MPQRIQLHRTKGWRKPEGTIVVARPSRWGNPYWHVLRFHGPERALELFSNTARGIWSPSVVVDWPDSYVAQIYDDHRAWLRRISGHPIDAARRELAGRDLACWCPPDQPCHADVLLEIAN